MGSIPPKKLARDLEGVVRDVAFELRLPWRLPRLRQAAFEAYQPPSANSGLPSEQAHKTELRRVRADVRKVGELLEPLPLGVKSLTPELIEAALKAFTPKQWETLVEDLDQEEIHLLEEYIDSTDTDESRDRYERLKWEIGAKRLHATLAAVVQRDLKLWSETERPKTEAITDPYWDAQWREAAREANCNNKGRTADGRSVDEMTSERSTATRLNKKRKRSIDNDKDVNPDQVGTWRKRMEILTFEQFFAYKVANEEFDQEYDDEQKRAVAFIEYHAPITKKYLRIDTLVAFAELID